MKRTKIYILIPIFISLAYISTSYFNEEKNISGRKIDSYKKEEQVSNKSETIAQALEKPSDRIAPLSDKSDKTDSIEEKQFNAPVSYDFNDVYVNSPKAIKAYGSLFRSKDKEESFNNDEYDSDWSGETTDRIYNEILYDSESGENKYPSLEVESLICKGTICKLEVRMNGENEEENGIQRSKLMYELLFMNGGDPKDYTGSPEDFVPNRLIAPMFFGDNGYRYYISKGINELKE